MNDTLVAAAAAFVRAYQERPALVAEQAGWSCTIVLCADDTGEAVTVQVADGQVAGLRDGAAPGAGLLVTADAATLLDVLRLRRSPSEPYLFGELLVHGIDADFLRLDYLTGALCPTG